MSGLLDFLQAASNSVAGNVTGPVDLITLALRKAGLPVPEESVGTSAWAKQKGLMRDVAPGAARVAGETAGILGQMLATHYAPQIAGGLLKVADNAAAPSTIAGLSASERGMALFDTTGLPDRGRELIQSKAEQLAEQLRQNGFSVGIQHGGSAAGPSSYLSVYDPQTGRSFGEKLRLSGHSKGPFQSQFVWNVATDDEFAQVLKAADDMRAQGVSKGLLSQQQAAQEAAQKTKAYWQSVLQRAQEKMASGQQLSNRERQAMRRAGIEDGSK